MLTRSTALIVLLVITLAGLTGYALGAGVAQDVAVVGANGATVTGDKWALIIGCNGYDPNEVGPLSVAVADAKRMRDTLVQHAGYAPERVILLTDEGLVTDAGTLPEKRPTYTTLRGQIAKFVRAHKASDVLTVFFAGHGFHSKKTGRDYLAPLDVQRADLDETAIAVDGLLEQLRESGACQCVLIADACRNVVGRAVPGEDIGLGDLSLSAAKARGIWYLSSCSTGQTSQEDPALGGGVFTYYFAEGLKGAADGYGLGKKDGYVTVTEAQAYAAAKVEAWSRARGADIQLPCRSERDVSGGEMVLSTPGATQVAATPTTAAQPMPRSAPSQALPTSTASRPAPAAAPEMKPSALGWGPNDKPYPDKFVVNPATGAKMVWVPAGTFNMGDSPAEQRAAIEQFNLSPGFAAQELPEHQVEITHGFWLGQFEVTVGQFRAFLTATGGPIARLINAPSDEYPVSCVSWTSANAYCHQYGFRLPTEAEWEYAARGPSGLRFPWGNEWDSAKCCNPENRGPTGNTFPVGSFPAGASWCGALDLAGSLYEWCSDWLGGDYYSRSPRSDPQGPPSGDNRIIRGGSFATGTNNGCRSANRAWDGGVAQPHIGFRCVLVPGSPGDGATNAAAGRGVYMPIK